MILFIDFLSNNHSFAYARDKVKISENIKLIGGAFMLEIETAIILNHKDCFVTSAGVYLIILQKVKNEVMMFLDVRKITEIETILFETETNCNKDTANELYEFYLELSKSHVDNVGLTSELQSE